MSIRDIIVRRRGTAGAWRIDRCTTGNYSPEYPRCTLVHYSTGMVTWHGTTLVDYATGYGSVSDQNGVNTAMRVLGFPYRYRRDARGGGPRIEALA